jgi:hypothetical protein
MRAGISRSPSQRQLKGQMSALSILPTKTPFHAPGD